LTSTHEFEVGESIGVVSAALLRPPEARYLYVFGHGAGAGMHHEFLKTCASILADHGVATFRYQFPYMEAGRRLPNPAPVLVQTVRSAVATAESLVPDLPILAGGKSMGGRMTSTAAASGGLGSVRGLAFFGFPLHAAGRDSSERGEHLTTVGLPMLFLQGTRDKLANLTLLRPLLDRVTPRPSLHVVDGADHGFQVLKRSGRTRLEVLEESCSAFADWAGRSIEAGSRWPGRDGR